MTSHHPEPPEPGTERPESTREFTHGIPRPGEHASVPLTSRLRVRDVMSQKVSTLHASEELSLEELLKKFRHVRHLPVVGANSRLVGMVTRMDVLEEALLLGRERWVRVRERKRERKWLGALGPRDRRLTCEPHRCAADPSVLNVVLNPTWISHEGPASRRKRMADMIRRPEVFPSIPATWDPFRVMREMMNWEPLQAQGGLVPFAREGGFIPSFEVKETKDAFVFKADLPGVKENDVEITLTENRLTINGKREAERKEEGESYYAFERSYGSFSRTFTIPVGCDPDHVNANMENGVLTLVVPKKPEAQPKRIGLKGLVEKAAEKLKT